MRVVEFCDELLKIIRNEGFIMSVLELQKLEIEITPTSWASLFSIFCKSDELN